MATKTISKIDIDIVRGDTCPVLLRWSTEPLVAKPISSISFASGCPRIGVASHGIIDGFDVFMAGIVGPTQLNSAHRDPVKTDKESTSDWHAARVVDANTIDLRGIVPFDDQGKAFKDWVSGGFVYYNTAVDLTGYTARMTIKDKYGGAELHSLTTENGGIALDVALGTITLIFSATDTAAFAWKKGVYDLEMVKGGEVTKIAKGVVTVDNEATT